MKVDFNIMIILLITVLSIGLSGLVLILYTLQRFSFSRPFVRKLVDRAVKIPIINYLLDSIIK